MKIKGVFLCIILTLALTGCGIGKNSSRPQDSVITNASAENSAESETSIPETTEVAIEPTETPLPTPTDLPPAQAVLIAPQAIEPEDLSEEEQEEYSEEESDEENAEESQDESSESAPESNPESSPESNPESSPASDTTPSQSEPAPAESQTPEPESEEEEEEFVPASAGETVTVTGAVNVRSEPNVDESEVLGDLEEGETVTILDVSEYGWYLISYNGGEGWVYGEYFG